MLRRALAGASKTKILCGIRPDIVACSSIRAIATGNYHNKTVDQIQGTGYVVDSLETALWWFWTTADYEQAVLAAANLGDDADTTAAICGQIAGAYYGETSISARWLNQLAMKPSITRLAEQLYAASQQSTKPNS